MSFMSKNMPIMLELLNLFGATSTNYNYVCQLKPCSPAGVEFNSTSI